MDYAGNESWELQGDGYYLHKDGNLDMPKCVWNGVPQNQDDISYMFEDTTPIKACGDLPYHLGHTDIVTKTPQECRGLSSQVKRRRVLDFDDSIEDISSAFLKSKERMDALGDIPSEVAHWEACFQEDMSSSGFEDLLSEDWLADCLNDTDMIISSDDGNASGSSDVQIGITDLSSITPDSSATPKVVQRTVKSSRNVVFKGRKSYMRTPAKLASSIIYPFDIVKPCGVGGDVTLKDINQRIRTPPPLKMKQVKDDPSTCFPTSAFSGKPVVGKTKIPTQGGKGSITIMRTKG